MAAGAPRVGLQNNIPEIASRIERVKWAVRTEYPKLLKGALEQTQTELMRTTPKRTGRMATGWRVRTIGGKAKGRVAMAGWVYNHWAEKGRNRYQSQVFAGRRRSGSGRLMRKGSKRKVDGELILRILEFGSQPHTIEANHITKSGRKGMLAFVPFEKVGSVKWSSASVRAGSETGMFHSRSGGQVGGETVFVRKVRHPGTKPVGMVRRARMHLRERVRKVNIQVATIPQKVMRGKF